MMILKFLTFFLVCFSVVAEETITPNLQASPKSREVNIQHLMVKPADLEAPEKTKAPKLTCETSDGTTYKKGEAGYDACIYDIKLKAKGSGNKVGVGFGSD